MCPVVLLVGHTLALLCRRRPSPRGVALPSSQRDISQQSPPIMHRPCISPTSTHISPSSPHPTHLPSGPCRVAQAAKRQAAETATSICATVVLKGRVAVRYNRIELEKEGGPYQVGGISPLSACLHVCALFRVRRRSRPCVLYPSALSASAHVNCTRCFMTPSARLLSDTGARRARGRPPHGAAESPSLHRHLPPQVGVRDRAAGCAAAALARLPRGWWRRQACARCRPYDLRPRRC